MSFDNFRYLPYVTFDLPVQTENPPVEYCPTVTIDSFDVVPGVAATQFSQNAALERLRIVAVLDKVGYEAACLAAGVGGTLETNFQDAFVCFTDSVPVALPPCTPEFISYVGSGFDYLFEYVFRPPLAWVGYARYVNLVFRFSHNNQDDYIIVPIQVATANESTELNGEFYQDGVIADFICREGGPVTLEVTHDQPTWVPFFMLERNGEIIAEWDTFDGTLPKLNQEPFSNYVTSDTPTYERIDLDQAGLRDNDCVIVVLKDDATIGPECSEELDMTITFETITATSSIKITWDTLVAVDNINIGCYVQDLLPISADFQVSAGQWLSGPYFLPFQPFTVVLTFTVTVGECNYTETVSFVSNHNEQFTTIIF